MRLIAAGARTGRVAGLSLTAWQAMLVVNISSTAHGISIGPAGDHGPPPFLIQLTTVTGDKP
jgi:hypothetical protein